MRASEAESAEAVERLVADGLLERRDGKLRTTRRWQSAMARAAYVLLCSSGDASDLRVPIAAALVEIYGVDAADDRLTSYIRVMLPIERMELDPRGHARPQAAGR